MIKWFVSLALVGAALVAPARAQESEAVGKTPPEFDAKKWYNTAPISLEDLKGKSVHLVIFRTW